MGRSVPFSWCDGYEPHDVRMRNLYKKGLRLQWNVEELPWSTPIDPAQCPLGSEAFGFLQLPVIKRLGESQREYLRAHLTALVLSQFLHGEQGALLAAAQLAELAPDLDGKMCSALQVMDEARHVDAFAQYVKRCAIIYAPRTRLLETLHSILHANTWEKKVIGMQIVVEGMAIASFHDYRRSACDPLLNRLLELVVRDEARHVALGPIYVTPSLSRMGEDEREDLADFAYEITLGFRSLAVSFLRDAESILQQVGVSFDDICREAVAVSGTRRAIDAVNAFVVPALERVGAITPRVKAMLDRAKMLNEADEGLWRTLELSA